MIGCVGVDLDIAFNWDGSGDATIKITVPASVGDVDSITRQVRERLPNWRVTERSGVNGGATLIASKSFKTLSEVEQTLDLGGQGYAVKMGAFKSRFVLSLISNGNEDGFSHFVVTATVPGQVLQTNGEKIRGNRVRWDLTGRGKTNIFLESEGIRFSGLTTILGVVMLGILVPAMLYVRRLSVERWLILPHRASRVPLQRRRFCEDCGSPLEPGSKFCQKCGAAVVEEPP
jgi:hypothetical protein